MRSLRNKRVIKEVHTCKDWRDCENCYNLRMIDWKNVVMNGVERNGGGLLFKSFEWDERDEMEKTIRRIRHHGNQSTITFRAKDKLYLFHTDEKEDGTKMIWEEVEALPWRAIVNTMEGCRISATGFFKERAERMEYGGETREKVTTFFTEESDEVVDKIVAEAASILPDEATDEEVCQKFLELFIGYGHKVSISKAYRNVPTTKVSFEVDFDLLREINEAFGIKWRVNS